MMQASPGKPEWFTPAGESVASAEVEMQDNGTREECREVAEPDASAEGPCASRAEGPSGELEPVPAPWLPVAHADTSSLTFGELAVAPWDGPNDQEWPDALPTRAVAVEVRHGGAGGPYRVFALVLSPATARALAGKLAEEAAMAEWDGGVEWTTNYHSSRGHVLRFIKGTK